MGSAHRGSNPLGVVLISGPSDPRSGFFAKLGFLADTFSSFPSYFPYLWNVIPVLPPCLLVGLVEKAKFFTSPTNMVLLPETLWPSGLRRWLKAPFRKGVGSNPTGVIFMTLESHRRV